MSARPNQRNIKWVEVRPESACPVVSRSRLTLFASAGPARHHLGPRHRHPHLTSLRLPLILARRPPRWLPEAPTAAVRPDTLAGPHRRAHLRLSDGLRMLLQTPEARLPARECPRGAQVGRPQRLPPPAAARPAGPDRDLHQLRPVVLWGLQGVEPLRQLLGPLRRP